MAVTANTGTAGIAANGIRTLKLDWPHRNELDAESPLVALGRTGDEFVLVVADEKKRDERPYDTFITALSVMVNEDPFPGWSMENRQMIWVKTYSENDGLLPQLEKAGWSRPVGSTIKQGFVTLPLAEVMLSDTEMIQRCALCEKWESIETKERFKRCSMCKRRYYCSIEHQHQHWPKHKKDCKDLVKGRLAEVENRRRDEGYIPPKPAGSAGDKIVEMTD